MPTNNTASRTGHSVFDATTSINLKKKYTFGFHFIFNFHAST